MGSFRDTAGFAVLTGVVTVILAVIVVLFQGYDVTALVDLTMKGGSDTWGAVSNAFGVSYPVVTAILFFALIVFSAFVALTRAIIRRASNRIGQDKLAAVGRDQLLQGLNGQSLWMTNTSSWPPYTAAARLAASPSRVDFGRAKFTTSRQVRNSIRRLFRQSRGDAKGFERCIALVVGAPGAGKSVLTQELQKSLLEGLKAEKHGLIPLVIFAAAISDDMFVGEDLEKFLSNYFRKSPVPNDHLIASYIDSYWMENEFVIFVDGLDEIPQRSEYEHIQRLLKSAFTKEFARGGRKARLALVSCRVDDDIGLFKAALKLELHGLAEPQQKKAYVKGILASFSRSDRKAIRDVIFRDSKSVVSSDVFSRNPYFLALLIHYFEEKGPLRPIDPNINFRFLMEEIIARESDRAYVANKQPTVHKKWRAQVQGIASLVLQHLAFSMTNGETPGALYGKSPIDRSLIDGFQRQLLDARERDKPGGLWYSAGGLWEVVSKAEVLPIEEQQELLHGSALNDLDLQLLISLVAKLSSQSAEELVFAAFGTIAVKEDAIERVAWYRELSKTIATACDGALGDRAKAAACLLFARGLAAAHALRLLYIWETEDGVMLRFRHRRLAEYYAAVCYNDRWETVKPAREFSWLSPVLNLVVALQQDVATSFEWLIAETFSRHSQSDKIAWRNRVFAVVEAAGFVGRGLPQTLALQNLVQSLLNTLSRWSDKNASASTDAVTQLALADGVRFLADIGVRVGEPNSNALRTFESSAWREPVHSFLRSARVHRAVEQLTQTQKLTNVSRVLWSLCWPSPILGNAKAVIANSMRAELLLCWFQALLFECALVALSYWICLSVISHLLDHQAAVLLSVGFMGVLALLRLNRWWGEPSSAMSDAGVVARILSSIVFWFPKLWNSRSKIVAAAAKFFKTAPRVIVSFGATLAIVSLVGAAIVGTIMALATGLSAIIDAVSPTEKAISQQTDKASAVAVDSCEEAKQARERLVGRKWPTIDASDAEITSARSSLSGAIDAMARANISGKCRETYKGNTYPIEIVTALLIQEANYRLVPVSSKPPLFTEVERQKLNALSRKTVALENRASDIQGFREAQETEDAIRNLRDRLLMARATGRYAASVGGAGSQNISIETLASLDSQSQASVESLRKQKALFRERVVYWSIAGALIAVLLAAMLKLLRTLARRMADRKVIENVRGSGNFGDLASALGEKSVSDFARKLLIDLLLDEYDVESAELNVLDEMASRMLRSLASRDRTFGQQLAEAVVELQKRLVKRSDASLILAGGAKAVGV